MQRTKKLPQRYRRRRWIVRWFDCRTLTCEPGDDAPEPWVAATWPADSMWRRNRQRQSRCEDRQPTLFVLDERRRGRATGEANGELLAQTKQPIVPPFADIDERKMQQFSVLVAEQRSNQRLIDGKFGWRFRRATLCSEVAAAR